MLRAAAPGRGAMRQAEDLDDSRQNDDYCLKGRKGRDCVGERRSMSPVPREDIETEPGANSDSTWLSYINPVSYISSLAQTGKMCCGIRGSADEASKKAASESGRPASRFPSAPPIHEEPDVVTSASRLPTSASTQQRRGGLTDVLRNHLSPSPRDVSMVAPGGRLSPDLRQDPFLNERGPAPPSRAVAGGKRAEVRGGVSPDFGEDHGFVGPGDLGGSSPSNCGGTGGAVGTGRFGVPSGPLLTGHFGDDRGPEQLTPAASPAVAKEHLGQ